MHRRQIKIFYSFLPNLLEIYLCGKIKTRFYSKIKPHLASWHVQPKNRFKGFKTAIFVKIWVLKGFNVRPPLTSMESFPGQN